MSLIRSYNKSNVMEELTLADYVRNVQLHFRALQVDKQSKIEELRLSLFKAKLELFRINNRALFDEATRDSIRTVIDAKSDTILNEIKLIESLGKQSQQQQHQATSCFQANVDFLTSLIKMKSIAQRNALKLGPESIELVLDCLRLFLDQVEQLFFNELTLPIDCLLHGLQQFVNVYDLEWLYYIKSHLLPNIVKFINQLIRFLLLSDALEIGDKKRLASKMIIIFGTNDFLINHVLASLVSGLQIVLDYVVERAGSTDQDLDLDQLIGNSEILIESIELIVRIRALSNYKDLHQSTKRSLIQLINTIFIKISDKYPLFAIKLSKVIQLLGNDSNPHCLTQQ